MKNMIKDALILFAITLCAGVLLGYVNDITKGPIEIAKENAKQAAYNEVFPNADKFDEVEITGQLEEIANELVSENGKSHDDINAIIAASKDNELLGYVFLVTNHEGYGGDIQLAVGLTKDYTLNGISILSISETAGLGMEAPKVLVPQFLNKNLKAEIPEHSLSPFTYTKSGSTNELEIDAISGATITTKSVLSAVNSAINFYEEALLDKCLEGGEANE